MKVTDNVSKLPKWARERIAALERQRDEAVSALNGYLDAQTPSPVRVHEWVSTGEAIGPSMKLRYVQADTVEFVHGGIALSVRLRDDRGVGQHHIELQWHDEKRQMDEVAMIPQSFQQVHLKAKEQMR